MAKISHFVGIGVYLFEFFVGSFNHLIKVDNFKFLELSGVGIFDEFVDFPEALAQSGVKVIFNAIVSSELMNLNTCL
jgi:hypothetical protein